MRRLFLAVLSVAALAGFSQAARAEAVKFLLDKPHTQVVFFINHMGFSNSSGKFLDYAGTIQWDKDAPEKSAVEATIRTASLDMGDATWDEHMKGEKFFDVAKFPVMTFKSTAIEKTGDATANITGDLTIKGVTKPVVLATTLNKQGPHPFANKDWLGFSATTTIKRSDFGMGEAIPLVGDEVQIRIEVEAAKDDPTAAGNNNP